MRGAPILIVALAIASAGALGAKSLWLDAVDTGDESVAEVRARRVASTATPAPRVAVPAEPPPARTSASTPTPAPTGKPVEPAPTTPPVEAAAEPVRTAALPAPSPPPPPASPAPASATATPTGPMPTPASPTAPTAVPSLPPAAADPAAEPPPSGPPDPRVARDSFGSATTPSKLAPRAIGFYSRGCLAGAQMLPVDGPAWQAMRLSRQRNWGHPDLIAFVEKLAKDVRAGGEWPGLLVGDLSQPRGGPMRTGHASHQIGLDADIWLTPMPDRRLTPKEREDIAATDMLGPYKLTVDPTIWTPAHVSLIKRASGFREVERILVHPAIKKALCDAAASDRDWLRKVRPYWGHHYHFHVRIACPRGSDSCKAQAVPPADDGCGKELDDWMQLLSAPTKPVEPPPSDKPVVVARPMRVDQLPAECRMVLDSDTVGPRTARSFGAQKAAEKTATQKAAVAKPLDKASDKSAQKAVAK